MNKEKIVGLSDRLNEIVDEANRRPNGKPSCITWDKAVYAIEALSKEANSKIIMPKVFDDWYKDITAESSDIQGIVTCFKFTIDGKYNNFGPEKALFDWVHSGKYNRVLGMNLIDKTRYKKCLEAILHGYEVEK